YTGRHRLLPSTPRATSSNATSFVERAPASPPSFVERAPATPPPFVERAPATPPPFVERAPASRSAQPCAPPTPNTRQHSGDPSADPPDAARFDSLRSLNEREGGAAPLAQRTR